MFNSFFDMLIFLRNVGYSVLKSIRDFGYNFFFTTISDWLGISFGSFGNITLFEFFFVGGLTTWVIYKLVKWIIF